jgi:hypothetical protein
MSLVWFSDLKFATETTAMIMRTSNPPHDGNFRSPNTFMQRPRRRLGAIHEMSFPEMNARRLGTLTRALPFLFAVPGLAFAQPVSAPTRAEASAALQPQPPAATFSQAQLDQLLAPIALYPDQLLLQVLMAATFPPQVVDAGKWLQDSNNASLSGDQLVATLQPLPWDPSVKSLCAFPQIITMMNEHLDWAEALGQAFGAQQVAVMARVQFLRQLAMKSGRLKSTPQLRVEREQTEIVIAPENPAQIYVPVYNPAVVYGAWPDADAPPVYLPPPPRFYEGEIGAGIVFGAAFVVAAPLWGWGHPDWRRHEVIIDPGRYRRITNVTNITQNNIIIQNNTWRRTAPVVLVPEAQRPRPAAAAAPLPGTVSTTAIRPHPAPGARPAEVVRPPGTPERPAAEGVRPLGTPERPAAEGVRPPGTPERPAAEGARPPGTPERPAAEGARPPGAPERPAAEGARPPGPPERPAAEAAHPPGTPQHPAAEAAHPPGTPPHPAAAIEHPPGAPQHPAAAIEHAPGAPPHPEAAAHPPAPPPHPAPPHPEAAAHPPAPPPHPAPPHPEAAAHPPAPPPHPPAAAHPPAPPHPEAAAHPPAPPHPPAAAHPEGKPPPKPGEEPKPQ